MKTLKCKTLSRTKKKKKKSNDEAIVMSPFVIATAAQYTFQKNKKNKN